MTTRQRTLPSSAAAAIIALAATVSVTAGAPAPAEAAVPGVASSWSSLMHRSLTRDTQAAALRRTYATEQAAIRTWTTEAAAAAKAGESARTRLTAAVAADANARSQHVTASKALATAKVALSTATKRKPRSKAAVTRASRAVSTATLAANTRRLQAQKHAAALVTARTGVKLTAARVTKANAALAQHTAAATRARTTYLALPTAAALAGQAATLSRDVVTQFRSVFKTTDTTRVYGVTVNKTIAFSFKRMVDDAGAAGIRISAGGFRTTQRQIELRKINGCPDVWTAPASSCRVPTAIPGRSLHELGLAVDVTSGGRTLTRSSKAFKWMTTHARKYGFVNLPSEAWHWSITGG
ncbi:M15 family metallopeptidase [Actinoplanes teichomyceticus]|uniref:D-alanyl-D-alanine carboxypeptidase n=1 Tax=Actinoplanes teichomyceticus TaxID=1867 RepID=A0A561VLI1_ACTTI|nr:M15 family metallopeptidase [Actinoplanes teichomyceticus]TWG12469.1 D-alanyl-D-alanine carboxypeptidase [Actinoplanes teichomyceticus]GIF13834.1 hypothetical protein Ate01nite_38660 [Actinoplanes teichomyceticus]